MTTAIIIFLVVALVYFAATAVVRYAVWREAQRRIELYEAHARVQEKRHEREAQIIALQAAQLVSLGKLNHQMREFIENGLRQPGDDADWWKRQG